MRKFAQAVVNFVKREDGPTAVEYAVMLALIIVVCITAITALGTNANKTFTNVCQHHGQRRQLTLAALVRPGKPNLNDELRSRVLRGLSVLKEQLAISS